MKAIPVLFIGNSFTKRNDLPGMLERFNLLQTTLFDGFAYVG